MPPTLGGSRIRRSLTAIVSALSVSALTFVGALPNATRSSASANTASVNVASTDATPSTTYTTTRTVKLSAKTNAVTDKKKATASYSNVSLLKVQRARFAAYFAFPAVSLAKGESISSVSLSLPIKKASHAKSGKLVVRPVSSNWSGAKVTERTRPKVAAVIGTAKVKTRGTVTVKLKASKAKAYLTKGMAVRITRAGSKYLVKMTKKPVKVTVKITKKVTRTVKSITSGKPVFGMYFPPYPITLENVPASRDYYTKNYLVASGENGKWAKYGGLIRDRPIPRDPLSGDWELTDMKTEVKQAISGGLTGFTACVLSLDPSDKNYFLIEKLMKASSSLSSSFKVMLMPDMTVLGGKSAAEMAKGLAALSKYDSIYRLKTGEVLISPFWAEGRSPSYYKEVISLMKSKYGVSAALMPIFLEANYMTEFNDVSVAFANWGIRDAYIASHEAYWPNFAKKAHALGKPWMEPVAVQDERPNQQVYDEAANTETLRATWNRAITQGADMVMLVTWNDYSECTSFAPSTDHGWAFLDVNKYFLTKFRTGSYPKITKDKIVISHRIQKASTMPTSYTAVMKLRSSNGQTQPRDTIEVVTMLAASSQVSVKIGGQTHTYTAPAGFKATLFKLSTGYFTATAKRSGKTVATVTTKDAVSYTTEQQDLSYHAVVSD